MLNKVILIGHLAVDPELKYTPSGVAVTTCRIAVSRDFKNAQGERDADFIDLVMWRQTAEFCANYLGKGRLVSVEGRLQVRSYQAQDGSKRRVSEVVVDTLKSLQKPPDGNGGSGGSGGGGKRSGGGDQGNYPEAGADELPPYDDPFQEE